MELTKRPSKMRILIQIQIMLISKGKVTLEGETKDMVTQDFQNFFEY